MRAKKIHDARADGEQSNSQEPAHAHAAKPKRQYARDVQCSGDPEVTGRHYEGRGTPPKGTAKESKAK